MAMTKIEMTMTTFGDFKYDDSESLDKLGNDNDVDNNGKRNPKTHQCCNSYTLVIIPWNFGCNFEK